MQKHEVHICGEVQYDSPEGTTHSDVCITQMPTTQFMREFYHTLLDEWFDQANGTGWFVIGKSELLKDAFEEYGVQYVD